MYIYRRPSNLPSLPVVYKSYYTVKPRFWNTSWSAVIVFQNRGLFQNRGPHFGKKIEKGSE